MAGNILGEMIGPAFEGIASAAQYQAAKHERNVSWRRQQAWELMAPSLRVEGMRRAGINPILLATQGMTGGPGHIATASPGQKPSFNYNHARALSSAKQAKAMDTQLQVLEQQLIQAKEKSRQEVQHSNIIEKYGMAMGSQELLRSQMEIESIMAGTGLTSARQSQSAQEAARAKVDRLLMEMGVPGARAMEELYTKYPFLRQIKEFGGGGLVGKAAGLAGAGAAAGAGYFYGKGKKRSGKKKGTSRGGATYQRGNEYYDSETGEVHE